MTLRRFTLLACAAVAMSAAAQYTPQVVIEEGTGEWCKWCVRGIVAMEKLGREHPDNFIPIAIHYNDEFAMPDYITDAMFNGFPVCNVNRMYMGMDVSPDLFDVFYGEVTKQNAKGTIQLTAALDGGGDVIATTHTTFGAEVDKNINVAIVLTEDNLVGIYQANAYAGGYNGEMGGWENLPDRVQYPVFNHVAREIYPTYDGQLLAEGAAEGAEFNNTFTVPIPADVIDPRNLVANALLLYNGRIIGGQKVPLCDQKAALADMLAVEGALTKPKEITATVTVKNPDSESNIVSFGRFVLIAEDATETPLKSFTINLSPAEEAAWPVVVATGKLKEGKYAVRVEASANGSDWQDTGLSFSFSTGDDAIKAVEADAEQGSVRWFNLQGVEVNNPLPGHPYIRVQGDKAVKILR